MTINFMQLRNELKNGNGMLFVICGQDAYLKGKAVEQIRRSLTIENEDINVQRFSSDVSFDEIMNCANTPPFFSTHKLLIADDFGKDRIRTDVAQQYVIKLTQFALDKDKSVCLIILTESTIFDNVEDLTKVVCNKVTEREVTDWVVKRLKQLDKTVSPQTALTVAKYCLCDMARVSVETEKLASYCDEKEITDEMVELLVHKDTEYIVFNLTDAISAKNADLAIAILQSLLDRGEDVYAILGALYSSFKRMYYLKTSAYSTNELAIYLSVKESALYYTQNSAKRFRAIQLKKALEYFEIAEGKLKQFYKNVDVIKELVMKLLAL